MAESKLHRIDPYLEEHYQQIRQHHLRDLLSNEERNSKLRVEYNNILLDYSHEKITEETLVQFQRLVQDARLFEKIQGLFEGQRINKTENRSVLHVALRLPADKQLIVDGQDLNKEVQEILQRINAFSTRIRNGELPGYTGSNLQNVVIIGIGGSYLGIEFVYEAIRSHQACSLNSNGRRLRFLANVDPTDFSRAVDGLSPEQTLFVINSKTFTTAETMLNAKTCRNWLIQEYSKLGHDVSTKDIQDQIVNSHMCAVSTNLQATSEFGISSDRVFGFWEWVGGRFSVCSAVGVLPLSLHFGFDLIRQFLDGAHDIDTHFQHETNILKNLPILLGLIGYYRTTVQNYPARALLPYSQALCKFAPHIQQVDMESNGKRVSVDGQELTYQTGAINFGEPGTNGQHSFYQLLHQGRVIPCEFIGFCQSQNPIHLQGEPPDALALGKWVEELRAEGVPDNLLSHKTFPGDRPSISLLFNELNPFACGQLLALYEHRTTVEGFLWNVNSFDQFGVELGKVLAKNVRNFFTKNRSHPENPSFEGQNFNSSTSYQLATYLKNSSK